MKKKHYLSDEKYSMHFIVKTKHKIGNVAFYDRASTRQQATNYMRSHYSALAREMSRRNFWKLIESGDNRNDGACFLDVGKGEKWDNRPNFFKILDDVRIDTVAVCELDRLARGAEAFDALEKAVKLSGSFTYSKVVANKNE